MSRSPWCSEANASAEAQAAQSAATYPDLARGMLTIREMPQLDMDQSKWFHRTSLVVQNLCTCPFLSNLITRTGIGTLPFRRPLLRSTASAGLGRFRANALDIVEGLSGSWHDDFLFGDDIIDLVGGEVGGAPGGSALTNIALIDGLQAFLDTAFGAPETAPSRRATSLLAATAATS